MNELRSFYNSTITKKIVKTSDWHIHFEDGTVEFDPLSGGLSSLFGNNNKEIVSGIEDKILTVARAQSNKGHYTDDTLKAGDILTQKVWSGYSWSLSGTNAVESAISMSDEYWKELGQNKPYIVSFSFAWHGSSHLTKSLGVPETLQHKSSRVINIDHPKWKHIDERDNTEVEAMYCFVEAIQSNIDKIGCVIFDSATWINGVVPFSEWWWKTLRELCDKHNILMISDDVASCWGRSKAYHSYQTIGFGVQPDISAVGKALTGGYAPLGAALCNERVNEVISKPGVWKCPGTWQPSMIGIYLMLNTHDYIEKNSLIQKSNDIEKKNITLGEKILSDGLIDNYRVSGTFLALDIKTKAPSVGYSSSKGNNNLRICVPLIANETYYKDLEKYIYEN